MIQLPSYCKLFCPFASGPKTFIDEKKAGNIGTVITTIQEQNVRHAICYTQNAHQWTSFPEVERHSTSVFYHKNIESLARNHAITHSYDIIWNSIADYQLTNLLHLLSHISDKKKDYGKIDLHYIKEMIAQNGHLCVTYSKKKMVAMATLHIMDTETFGKIAILEDFVVHPDYQKNGIGKILYREICTKACEENAISLLYTSSKPGAQKFYRKMGVAPDPHITVVRIL